MELKAALPADFSGKSSNAPRWIKAIKAYFTINPTLYSSDNDKVMTTLNKMSEGRGASFAEMWYDKMADFFIHSSKKTFNKFAENFKTTFYPFNTKATACLDLSKLVQKITRLPNGTANDGFQQYITDFQNLTSKAGIMDNITLIDQFSLGVDQQIATMILSMSTIPTTINEWIKKAKTFHAQKMHIQALWGERPQPSTSFLRPQKDPNAMDVDNVTLSKLTPTECAKCIREGHCFHCRKTGHNATTCCTPRPSSSTPTCPQNIRTTETTPAPPPKNTPTPLTRSKLDEYVNSLKTSGKSDDDIFSVLKMCYEEPSEELAEVFTPESKEHGIFKKGSRPDILFP